MVSTLAVQLPLAIITNYVIDACTKRTQFDVKLYPNFTQAFIVWIII